MHDPAQQRIARIKIVVDKRYDHLYPTQLILFKGPFLSINDP
jgi:hypothetical protein